LAVVDHTPTKPDATAPLDDRSLRLPKPAVRGLAAAGITTLGAAWAAEDADVLALHGAFSSVAGRFP
jgi:hypothetical protein